MIIGNVEIGNNAKNTLSLLNLDLFSSYLFGRSIYRHRGRLSCDLKLAPGHNLDLSWIYHYVGRDPGDKPWCAYCHVVADARSQIVEGISSIITRNHRVPFTGDRALN